MATIRKNVFLNVTLSVSQVLFPLLTYPHVSRVLLPRGMGEIGFVDSITQYFVLLAGLGIPLYGMREIAKVKSDQKMLNRLFSELLIIHVVSTIVCLIVYAMLFLFVPKLSGYKDLFIIGGGILLSQTFVIEWLFQGLEEFSFIATRSILIRLMAILAIFFLVKNASDTPMYYQVTLGAIVVNTLFNVTYSRKFIKFETRHLLLKRHFSKLVFIFSFVIVTSIYTIMDTTLLGLLSTDIQVGYYGTATKLTKIVLVILTSFSTAMIPPLSQAFHHRENERVHALLKKSFEFIACLGVPASVGLVITAPSLILLFAGNAFAPTVHGLQILAPSILFVGLSNIFGMQILNLTHHEKLFLKAALSGMVLSFAANIGLVPLFGFIGSSIASLVTELVVCMLLGYYALRICDFKPAWSSLFKAILASAVFFPIQLIVWQFHFETSVSLLLIIALCIFFYTFIQIRIFKNSHFVEIWRQILQKVIAG